MGVQICLCPSTEFIPLEVFVRLLLIFLLETPLEFVIFSSICLGLFCYTYFECYIFLRKVFDFFCTKSLCHLTLVKLGQRFMLFTNLQVSKDDSLKFVSSFSD